MTTVDALLEKVQAIAPTIRRYAQEAEQARRLSRPVVDAMEQAGLYRMARAKAFGGLELDPVSMFQVVEEVARHDSAAGWNLQLSLVVDLVLAWLPDEGAAEILEGHPEVTCGTCFALKQHTAVLAPLERPGTAYQGPLYRLTIWPAVALLAPPALGVARAAIDDFLELARTKTPSYTGSLLGARQVVQRQVAQAEAALGAGRAYLYDTFRQIWQAAAQGAEITVERKMQMQLATTYATEAAAKAVDLMHAAAGSSAIRNEYRFQQYFRDVHTMTQHAYSSASRYESVGALMLGVESDWPFFTL